MPLETATYVSDLVPTNPGHTDGLSQADSHARLIKSTLKATFPNFTAAALNSTQAQLDAAGSQSAGTAASVIPLGTAALPGLAFLGSPNTGIWSPAANQIAVSLNGVQALLMGGTALVTTLGVQAAAFTTTGAYSGGTGQLVPIGAVLEWYDDVLPTEGGYCWANGQIIASANTVCPVLLARWGSRFGGNGTTTMGVPDRRDTVGVGKATMGGTATRGIIQAVTIWYNTTIGQLIGEAAHALSIGEMPSHSHTVTDPGHTHTITTPYYVGSTNGGTTGGAQSTPTNTYLLPSLSLSTNITGISIANSGSGANHNNLQPSTTCNYILRLG